MSLPSDGEIYFTKVADLLGGSEMMFREMFRTNVVMIVRSLIRDNEEWADLFGRSVASV